ncbi:hypothetical protein CN926_00905 [Bacillus thuringiensis]|uniref:phage protein Gp36 family protein n=1 Tax=Bacillus thuringiensis TaxID=1428 RepID=UPI000BFCC4B3|nr:phage protein Gp36 family protein [Bacillus thuringiensis]PGL88593.1 hypothetical protein CN926_00905 [Bacillus thuringiensis]
MSYSTPKDLRTTYRQQLPSSVSDKDIQVFCDKATVYMNGILAKAYKVPFSPVPPFIKQVANDLTTYFFIEGMYTSQKPNLDEFYKDLKVRLDKLLQDILNGDMTLIDEDGNVVEPLPTWNNGYATTNDDEPFFDRCHPYW